MIRLVVFAFVALLTFGDLANAQQPAQLDRPPADDTRGSVTGTVMGDRGQPMIGAVVIVRRLGVIGVASMGRQVTTNNEGRFAAENLEPGLYSITANAPAYVMPPRDVDMPAPVYRIGDSIRFDLIKGGVITGTITNAVNEPVIGIRTRALMLRDANGQVMKGLLPAMGQAMSDDRGIYRIFSLPPGTYIIEVGGYGTLIPSNVTPYDTEGPTYAPSSNRDTAAEITVTSGQENTVDVRYRSEPGHIVSGTVTNIGQGANISLMSVNGGWLAPIFTLQRPTDRGFALYGVPDGVYDVTAQQSSVGTGSVIEQLSSDPKRITVKGADVTGIELTTKPLASITGTLVFQPSGVKECSGKRRPLIAETMVLVQRSRKDTDTEPLMLQRSVTSTFPDKDGNLMWKVFSGQYAFLPRFFARYWYLHSITLTTAGAASPKSAISNLKIDAARNWTSVKSGDRLSGLTITLAEGAGSIRGRLVTSEGQTPPPNLNVFLVPAEREKAEDVLRYFAVDVASDQSFSADNLPPGQYWIIAQPRLLSDKPGNNLRLPDAKENRTKIRAGAELNKNLIELKPCQNVTDYQLTIKP